MYIWFKIIGAIIGIIVCICVIAFFSFFYRKGWDKKTAKVTKKNCFESSTSTSCSGRQNTSCSTTKAQTCEFNVDAPEFPKLSRTFNLSNQQPPDVGDAIEIYFNPDEPEDASLAPPLPVTLILVITGIITVISIIWVIFLFYIKDNPDAQRVGAFIGAADVASNMFD